MASVSLSSLNNMLGEFSMTQLNAEVSTTMLKSQDGEHKIALTIGLQETGRHEIEFVQQSK